MANITLPSVKARTSYGIDLDANAQEIDFVVRASDRAAPKSYFTIINKDANIKQLAFGATPPADDDYVDVYELGVFNGDHGLFGLGDLHVWVKGTGKIVVIY